MATCKVKRINGDVIYQTELSSIKPLCSFAMVAREMGNVAVRELIPKLVVTCDLCLPYNKRFSIVPTACIMIKLRRVLQPFFKVNRPVRFPYAIRDLVVKKFLSTRT